MNRSSDQFSSLLLRQNSLISFFFNTITGRHIILGYKTLLILILIQINQIFALSCFSLSSVMHLLFAIERCFLSSLFLQIILSFCFFKAKFCHSFLIVRICYALKEPSTKVLQDSLKAFSVYFLFLSFYRIAWWPGRQISFSSFQSNLFTKKMSKSANKIEA